MALMKRPRCGVRFKSFRARTLDGGRRSRRRMGMRHTPLSLFAAVARRGRTPGPPRRPPVIRFFFRIAEYTPVVIPNLEPVKVFTQPGEKASAGMADRL